MFPSLTVCTTGPTLNPSFNNWTFYLGVYLSTGHPPPPTHPPEAELLGLGDTSEDGPQTTEGTQESESSTFFKYFKVAV